MMNRRDFLQTAAAATAVSALSTLTGACGSSQAKFRRGVSSYSYQIALYTGEMSLEDMIAEAADIGANAIELLPDELREYPNFSDQFVKQWHGWMDKYHTVADAYTQHQDIYPAERLRWDIEQAKRLGFTCIRMMLSTSLEIVEQCLPDAEKANVALLYEVHGPTRIDGPEVEGIVKLMEKTKSAHLGLNPDFSLWEKWPSPVKRDASIRAGRGSSEVVKFIDEAHANGEAREKIEAEVAKRGGGATEKAYIRERFEGYQDPKKLLPLKPYIRRWHAKFWEMTPDYKETSIPYDEVIQFLIKNGFGGVMASEYEGQRSILDIAEVDEVEQVRRHQVMLKRLLGEA
jgi:hypothetical protein